MVQKIKDNSKRISIRYHE